MHIWWQSMSYLNVLAWEAKLRAISVTNFRSFVVGPIAMVVSAKMRADRMSSLDCVYFRSEPPLIPAA